MSQTIIDIDGSHLDRKNNNLRNQIENKLLDLIKNYDNISNTIFN